MKQKKPESLGVMRSGRSLFYNETPVFVGVVGLRVLGGVGCKLGLLGLASSARSLFAMLPIISAATRVVSAIGARTVVARTRVTLNVCRGGVTVGEFLRFSWAGASNLGGFLLEGNHNSGYDLGVVHGQVEVELS